MRAGVNLVNNMKNIIFLIVCVFVLLSCSESKIKETYYESGELRERFIFPTKSDFESNLNYEVYHYNIDGLLEKVFKVVNGQIDGTLLEYYNNDSVKRKIQFKSGKKHGVEKIMTPQGEVVTENLFIDDMLMNQMKAYNTPNGSVNFFYYNVKDSLEECGRLVYDSEDAIIKDESFHYKFNCLDTLMLGKEYNLEIEAYTFGEDNVIKELVLGEFNSFYEFIDKGKLIRLSSKNNKISFPYIPKEEGYKVIMGKLSVESMIEIDGKITPVSREMIVYRDFVVER